MDRFDIAVLGGGPGGYAAALRAALRGAKVCCVESGRIGGTCLNTGCIPAKALLHTSSVFHEATHARALGLRLDGAVDGPAVMARVASVVANLRKGVEFLLDARKVQIVRGRGKLLDGRTIAVQTASGSQEISAGAIILATGSRPARPAAFPFGPRVFTTEEACLASDLPASILIVGGGVIGCEFATAYAELGIRTTLVEMLEGILSPLDPDAARFITRSLTQRGVEILTGRRIVAMRADDAGVTAEVQNGPTLSASAALIAVGRPPNVEDIGLEQAGVHVEGIIPVDEHCRTNVEGVYAVGDVAQRLQYAHLAARMGVVAADCATGHEAVDDRQVVPVGVYTHPEVAAVGLSEQAARAAVKNVRVSKFPYLSSGMAQAYAQTEGAVKLIGDADTGKILGALVIGAHATDVIQEIALAMRNRLPISAVAETIHPHPTFVEAVGESAENWMGLPLHLLK